MTYASNQSDAPIRGLLVEDNPDDALLTRRRLHELGHEVFEASTLATAMALLDDGDFDVVLLDLHLPDSDGLDGVRKVVSAHPTVPLIALTGAEDVDTGVEVLRAGASGHLGKSELSVDSLDRVIRFGREAHRSARLLEDTVADLQVAVTQLREVNAQLDRVAASVAHDLMSPLSAIRLTAEVARRHLDGGLPVDELLNEMHTLAVRAGDVVEDVLMHARQPDVFTGLGTVDLNEVMDDVIAHLGSAIIDDTHLEVLGALPKVNGERTPLRQLMANLISNAARYRRPGVTPHITVEAREVGDGQVVEVIVSDDGLGIPPEHRQAVFEYGVRLDEPDRADIGGSGIGLATCRGIVARYGGRIWAEDSPLGGISICLTLPGSDAVA